MPVSRLDTAYRTLVLSKFFTKGWGKPENLKKLFEFRKTVSQREACFRLVPSNYPVIITKESISSENILLEGHFVSPFDHHLFGLLPPASQKAYFQVVLPTKWQSDHYKPVCLHLAGTGDHFFFRRRNLMAKPLLKEAGIGAILLENPFYGLRKPKDQHWSCLHNVSDIFVMGACLILETLVLFHWCKRNGLGPLGITGISMGGHMASLAASNWPEPIVLVPCLSWTTASAVFTKGVMSSAINWELLEHQYFSDDMYSKEIKNMVRIVDDFFYQEGCYAAGQHFAKHFPQSLDHVNHMTTNENSVPSVDATRIIKNEIFPQSMHGLGGNKSGERDILKEVLTEAGAEEFIKNTIKSEVQQVAEEKLKLKLKDFITWQNITGNVVKKGDVKVKDKKEQERQKQEALQFMCGIMDECTHLSNFTVPVDTSLIIAVAAKDDAYVPRDGTTDIRDIWPDAEVRYLNAGHVGAYLLHQRVFRTAITDAFKRLKKKYGYEKCENVEDS